MLGRVFLLCVLLALAHAQTPTPHGIAVNMADGSVLELAVEGSSSFRITSIHDQSSPGQPLTSPMIDQHSSFAEFKTTSGPGDFLGIATAFGEVKIDPNTGAFSLLDSNQNTLTNSGKLVQYSPGYVEQHNDTCATVYPNTDAVGGSRTPSNPNGIPNSSRSSCCSACNTDSNCSFWVLDTVGHICYSLMNVVKRSQNINNRVSGGVTLPGTSYTQFNLNRNNNARFYGGGGSGGSPLLKTSSLPVVQNTAFQSPQYWSSEGYSAVGVAQFDRDPSQDPSMYPASWQLTSQATVQWSILGSRADLYLMPAVAPADGVRTFWELTGAPKVLPRHAFGFVACRWGWTDRAYIEQILQAFRAGQYPIDSFISDFEWYTPQPDYSLPDSGSPTFVDFSYNNVTFPNPIDQLADYASTYHVRFGGIRKPRLGNSGLITAAKSKGWILPNAARNLNYTMPDVRAWYAQQIAHFYSDGVEYWWNDEGETQYFTFAGWNQAQSDALTAFDPKKRHLTINRSYTPGMQRYGLVIWTGDITVTWGALVQTVGYLLNWGMSGVSYLTCDIGGFNGNDTPADLLVRWYQVGTFLGVFRVHSKLGNTPHFPFLYDPASAQAMQKAMVWRYQLLPTVYSLAHQMYESGQLVQRPVFFEYPSDSQTFSMVSQWMLGSHIMIAPVLSQDSSVQVYLPADLWFEYGTATTHSGPATLSLYNVAMDHCPVYVRAGAVIPLAPSSLQYSEQLPGGPLTVQIYAGKNGRFVMVEDDGHSRAYESSSSDSNDSTRHTTFAWDDSKRLLSWTVQGAFSDSHTFTQLSAVLFVAGGPAGGNASAVVPIGITGSIQF